MSTTIPPDGWTRVALGDVVVQVKDRLSQGGERPDVYVPGGSITKISFAVSEWLSADDGLMGPAFHMIARPGDVLYKSRVPHGVAVADRVGICANTTYVLRTRDENVLCQGFIPYVLTSLAFLEHESLNDKGSTNLYLNFSDIARYEFALPPLDEQQRIVEVLSALVNYQDSLLQQVAAAWNLRDSVLEEFLESANQSWPSISIRELAVVCTGGIWGSDPGTDEVDVLVYRQTEFNDDGRLSRGSCVSRSASKRQLESRRLQPGDILLQKSAGTPSLPGRVVIVPNSIEPDSTCSNFLQLLRANPEKCEPRFLFWVLWYRHRRGVALEFQRGTNIRNLDLNRYLGQTVRLPSRTEQQLLLNRVSLVEDLIDKAEQALADAVSLGARLREVLLGVHSVH